MKFRFPVIIIDEDYNSENTSGFRYSGTCWAIEKEDGKYWGLPVTGIYPLSFSNNPELLRFVLSIDD